MRGLRRSAAEVGEDPDYRFTLANERTFLAWIRTSLALLAGGVAVLTVLPEFGPPGSRLALGVILLALSAALAAASYRRWDRTERCMRLKQPLPPTPVTFLLAGGVALVATVVAVLALLSR